MREVGTDAGRTDGDLAPGATHRCVVPAPLSPFEVTVIVGEATTFHGGHGWLAEHGVEVVLLDDPECTTLMREFIEKNPALWNEDIGRD